MKKIGILLLIASMMLTGCSNANKQEFNAVNTIVTVESGENVEIDLDGDGVLENVKYNREKW